MIIFNTILTVVVELERILNLKPLSTYLFISLVKGQPRKFNHSFPLSSVIVYLLQSLQAYVLSDKVDICL